MVCEKTEELGKAMKMGGKEVEVTHLEQKDVVKGVICAICAVISEREIKCYGRRNKRSLIKTF